MKLKRTILFTVALIAIAVSCSKDKETIPVQPTSGAVTNLKGSISQQAVNGQWNANDAIGITMLQKGTTTILNNIYNYQYYTPTTAGNFEPSVQEKTIYFPQDGSQVTFKAYYPYMQNIQADLKIPVLEVAGLNPAGVTAQNSINKKPYVAVGLFLFRKKEHFLTVFA